MVAENVKFLTTNSPLEKLERAQKEITSIKGDVKDCNRELVRVSKEAKKDLNSSGITKKSSTDIEKRFRISNKLGRKSVGFCLLTALEYQTCQGI